MVQLGGFGHVWQFVTFIIGRQLSTNIMRNTIISIETIYNQNYYIFSVSDIDLGLTESERL